MADGQAGGGAGAGRLAMLLAVGGAVLASALLAVVLTRDPGSQAPPPAPPPSTEAPPLVVSRFGDSVGAFTESAFAAELAARYPGADVYQDVAGFTSMCAWIDAMSKDAARAPDVVVVADNGNPCAGIDSAGPSAWGEPHVDAQQDALALALRIYPPRTRFVVTGPLPFSWTWNRELDAALRLVAAEHPDRVVYADPRPALAPDGYFEQLLPCRAGEGVDLACGTEVPGKVRVRFDPASDGIHPWCPGNVEGGPPCPQGPSAATLRYARVQVDAVAAALALPASVAPDGGRPVRPTFDDEAAVARGVLKASGLPWSIDLEDVARREALRWSVLDPSAMRPDEAGLRTAARTEQNLWHQRGQTYTSPPEAASTWVAEHAAVLPGTDLAVEARRALEATAARAVLGKEGAAEVAAALWPHRGGGTVLVVLTTDGHDDDGFGPTGYRPTAAAPTASLAAARAWAAWDPTTPASDLAGPARFRRDVGLLAHELAAGEGTRAVWGTLWSGTDLAELAANTPEPRPLRTAAGTYEADVVRLHLAATDTAPTAGQLRQGARAVAAGASLADLAEPLVGGDRAPAVAAVAASDGWRSSSKQAVTAIVFHANVRGAAPTAAQQAADEAVLAAAPGLDGEVALLDDLYRRTG